MTGSVVIVGSGIFGATAALELHNRGWEVTLVDQGAIPHPKATSNDSNRVVRPDYGADDFYVDLGLEAIAGWHEWNRTWDEPPYHEDGFLLLSREPLSPGTFEGDSYERLAARGIPVARLDAGAIRARFPAWRTDDYPEAYHNPRAGWTEADRVLETLLRDAERAGVRIRPGAPMSGLIESARGVTGITLADDERLEADVVLVAAGPWTPKLVPGLADVMWPSGQPILYFQPENADAFRSPVFSPWAADISNSGWYGIAALADGRVKVASHGEGVRVDPGADLVVPASTEPIFRAFLARALPDLADAPAAGSRLCVYCDTWDGDFWIDHDPVRPGLVVATGGSGHGFKFAPVLGSIIADVVERRPNAWAHRFRWRTREGRRTEDARSVVDLYGER
jgi:glycine/D-amino acid oxidase-like deaminating enzyme